MALINGRLNKPYYMGTYPSDTDAALFWVEIYYNEFLENDFAQMLVNDKRTGKMISNTNLDVKPLATEEEVIASAEKSLERIAELYYAKLSNIDNNK
jgi:hypothetical protein